MGLFRKNKRSKDSGTDGEAILSALGYTPNGYVSDSKAMRLATVYACVDKISKSIARLPLYPYEVCSDMRKRIAYSDSAFEMLCFEPSPHMTRFNLMRALVVSALLKGDGFAVLERDSSGVATSMVFRPYDAIMVETEVAGARGRQIRQYWDIETNSIIDPPDMVHVMNFSYDGIRGVSTLEHARRTLGLADSSEEYAAKFFDAGGSSFGLLSTSDGRLNDEQRNQIRKEWLKNFNPVNGKKTGIAVLEGGMKYQSIAINPVDAQLIETRQFSVPEICRFFDISPVMVHDLSKSSYSTVEAVSIEFLTHALSAHLSNIELELRRKIYPPKMRRKRVIGFDTSAIIRSDNTSQANLYRTLGVIGAMTPNEVREKFSMPPIEGGDDAYIQVNMQKLSTAARVGVTTEETQTQ